MADVRYARVWFPGTLFSEDRLVRLEPGTDESTWRPAEPRAYQWWFETRTETQDGDEVLRGEFRDQSHARIIGRRMSVDEVRAEVRNSDTLVSNMESNGYDVVKCAQGYVEYRDGMEVIEP